MKYKSHARWSEIEYSEDSHPDEKSAKTVATKLLKQYNKNHPCPFRGIVLKAWVTKEGDSDKLKKLKEKYSGTRFNYEPDTGCKFCKGTGEVLIKKSNEYKFCICLFVNHKDSNYVGKLLREFSGRELKRMGK